MSTRKLIVVGRRQKSDLYELTALDEALISSGLRLLAKEPGLGDEERVRLKLLRACFAAGPEGER